MTQRRGLGRGLGALIPGGAPTPAETPQPTDAQEPAESPALRTRRTASPASADAEERSGDAATGTGSRPVDMFFSGDPAGETSETPAARRAARADLAGDMARAASERRSTTRRRTSTADGADDAGTAEATATAKSSRAASGSSAKTSAPAKSTTATKTTPKKSTPGKSTPGKSTAGQSTAAKSTAAKTTAAKSTKSSSAKAAGKTSAPDAPVEAERSREVGASEGSTAELMQVPGAQFAEIPIHEIRENPRNPRTLFEDDALDELAFSLREVGVLQPVVVRPISVTDDGESFELVMGERRWRAAQRAGLTSIPSIIRETSDDDLLRDALLENLHRTQLNPLEEAAAYQQLLEDFGITQDELSARIGRSRPQISNTLRLMRLPALVQRRLASGALSAGHARALLALDDPRLMEELAGRIVAEGLSVRAVERLVARGTEPTSRSAAPRRSTYDPRVVDITSRLSNRFEAPVRIDVGKRKGRITMEFTNLEDLERLAEALGIETSASEDSSEG